MQHFPSRPVAVGSAAEAASAEKSAETCPLRPVARAQAVGDDCTPRRQRRLRFGRELRSSSTSGGNITRVDSRNERLQDDEHGGARRDPELVTIEEAAVLLRVHRNWVYEHARALGGWRLLGDRGPWRFNRRKLITGPPAVAPPPSPRGAPPPRKRRGDRAAVLAARPRLAVVAQDRPEHRSQADSRACAPEGS
jgi:hypothetical protein